MEKEVLHRRPCRPPKERPPLVTVALDQTVDFRGRPDFPTSRFSLADMQEYGEWLLGRLERQWPGKSRQWWEGKINVLTSSNEFLFIKNEHGVLLVQAWLHAMDGKPRALEVFGWCREAHPVLGEPDRLMITRREDPIAIHGMASLYRFAREWMRARGCPWMVVGVCTDMPVSMLEERVKGECADWVVVK